MTPSVLVVLLHYTGMDDTVECLASLASQTYPAMHTLVMVNGSPDFVDSAAIAVHPTAEIVRLPDNLGWAGGNNAGIRIGLQRNFDMMCLLNNDTVLPPATIGTLALRAAELGPCVLHPAIDFYDKAEGPQLDPAARGTEYARHCQVAGSEHLFEIEYVYGCCVLVSAAVFREMGLIDERFFLQLEDADLGRRAHRHGFRIYCDTRERILHKESRAFGARRQPVKTYYMIRNSLLCMEKHSRRLVDIRTDLQRIRWTIWQTATTARGRPLSWGNVLLWCFSNDAFARSIRFGIRDYALRRFGRIRPADQQSLLPRDRQA